MKDIKRYYDNYLGEKILKHDYLRLNYANYYYFFIVKELMLMI